MSDDPFSAISRAQIAPGAPGDRLGGFRWGAFLTVGRAEDGHLIAVLSDGSPQMGHSPVTVLSVETVKSRKAARKWYRQALIDRPWETRQ